MQRPSGRGPAGGRRARFTRHSPETAMPSKFRVGPLNAPQRENSKLATRHSELMRTSTLQIRTAEGVVFSQQLAGPVTRFLAWFVDLLVFLLAIWALSWLI